MQKLISVLDVMQFRPNKEYFEGIGCEDDFYEYMTKEIDSRNVQMFYFENLIKFLDKEIKFHKGPIIKKFIIYFSARGVISMKVAEKFEDFLDKNRDAENFMRIIFGSNSLCLYLGTLIKGNRWVVRFYSKEALGQDFCLTFQEEFRNNAKLLRSGWNLFSTEIIQNDLSRFHNENFNITPREIM